MRRYIDAELAKAEFTGNFQSQYATGTVKAMIDNVPTADVEEVRHGEWRLIEEDVDSNGNNQYMCSLCEAGELHAPSVIVPYCWKCGAKMDKEKEK